MAWGRPAPLQAGEGGWVQWSPRGRAGPGLRGRAGETAGGAGRPGRAALGTHRARSPAERRLGRKAEPSRRGRFPALRAPPTAQAPAAGGDAPAPQESEGKRGVALPGAVCAAPSGDPGTDGAGARGRAAWVPVALLRRVCPGEPLLEFTHPGGLGSCPRALASVAEMMENLPPIGGPRAEPRAPCPGLQGPAGEAVPSGRGGSVGFSPCSWLPGPCTKLLKV